MIIRKKPKIKGQNPLNTWTFVISLTRTERISAAPVEKATGDTLNFVLEWPKNILPLFLSKKLFPLQNYQFLQIQRLLTL